MKKSYSPIIAIIDSGLMQGIIDEKSILGGVSFFIRNSELFESDEYTDKNGHGSQCAYIIHKYCPSALLYIIKIVHGIDGKSSSILLEEALNFLLDMDVDVINISMSISSQSNNNINILLEKLYRQGKQVVVSVENGKVSSFPANSPNCFGVRGLFLKNRYFILDKEHKEVICNCIPEFVPTITYKYDWFSGNSKDTACISAVIANIIKTSGNCDIIEQLEKISEIRIFHQTICRKYEWRSKETNIYKKLEPVFYKYIKGYAGEKDMIVMASDINRIIEMYDFLNDCEKLLQIKINYKNVNFFDLYSVKSIVKWFCKCIEEIKE